MPNDSQPVRDMQDDGTWREDEPLPAASEDKVLEETARLAREGRRQLDADPREHKPSA